MRWVSIWCLTCTMICFASATFQKTCPGNCTSQFDVRIADVFSECRDYVDYPFCLYDTQDQKNRIADVWARYQENGALEAVSRDCPASFFRMMCAVSYPKCTMTNDGLGATQFPLCKSTCENFYRVCEQESDMAPVYCGAYSGVGPARECTGAAPALTCSVVLGTVALALMVL